MTMQLPPKKNGKLPWIDDYTIKRAKIRWRNFAGRQERFNAEGDRNFTIFLTPHDSERLTEIGLNVKTLPPKEEGQDPLDFLKVKVNFRGRPPRLVLVTHRGRTQLDQDTAGLLDTAEIKRIETPDGRIEEMVDLILSPYWWENEQAGTGGIAVSVKSLYMTIVEDELEMMYGDLPEASGALRSLDYTPFNSEEDASESGVHFQ